MLLLDEERKRKKKEKEEEEKKRFVEEDLLGTIKKDTDFENIENTITPRALQSCYSKSLLMSMKVRRNSITSTFT